MRAYTLKRFSNLLICLLVWGSLCAQKKNSSSALDLQFTSAKTFEENKMVDKADSTYGEAIKLARSLKDKEGEAESWFRRGNLGFASLSPYDKVSTCYLQSLKIYDELGDSAMIGTTYMQLGIVNYSIGNFQDASNYFNGSIKYSSKKSNAAILRYLLGLCYSELGNYSLATKLLKGSLKEYAKGDPEKELVVRGFMGKLLCNQGKYKQCIQELEEAIDNYPVTSDTATLGVVRSFLCTAYLGIGDKEKAILNGEYALSSVSLTSGISYWLEASKSLHQAYAKDGQMDRAYSTLLNWKKLSDSIGGSQVLERMANQQAQFDFDKEMISQKSKNEIDRIIQQKKHSRTRNLGIGFSLVALILAFGFFSRSRYMHKTNSIIAKEKDRSENLLLNILPSEIAKELKEKGEATPQLFENVSILFTDFKDFTAHSETMSPKELVNELNHCFKAFDRISEKYGIEKIKTLGDSYMAVSGLPTPNEKSVTNLVLAALEMQQFITNRIGELGSQGKNAFTMRAGIHTGNVVAGIVGVKKFQYDIWGDTVNTASRMESNSEVGKVNISQNTYDIIQNDMQFNFIHRGKVRAKGKGEIDMYFVDLSKSS